MTCQVEWIVAQRGVAGHVIRVSRNPTGCCGIRQRKPIEIIERHR